MISLLTTLMVTASNSSGLVAQKISNPISDSKVVDDYQFEIIIPEQVILPKPGEWKEFKIGLKITNNTPYPRYFLLGNVIPVVRKSTGESIDMRPANSHANPGYGWSSYHEILAGESALFYSKATLAHQENRLSFCLYNSGDDGSCNDGILLAGSYSVSLRYWTNRSLYREAYTDSSSKIEKYKEINNVWTGNVYSPPKKIQLIAPK